ncbi:MAG: inositol monophosphatase family protein, partial [Burkholderiaceae bacterium]
MNPSSVIETMVATAMEAGRTVLSIYATDFTSTLKDDASPVTEADLRADRVIRAGLEQAFPGVFIWSEESTSQAG